MLPSPLQNFFTQLFNRFKRVSLIDAPSAEASPFATSSQSSAPIPDAAPSSSPSAENPTSSPPALPADLQTTIRANRSFTLAEAIGREGASHLKGESTIPRPLRAAAAIRQFITQHSAEPGGPFATTLITWATEDINLSRQLDTPLVALAALIEMLSTQPTQFIEFARQVAIAHSKVTGDRPLFQSYGHPPHPNARFKLYVFK